MLKNVTGQTIELFAFNSSTGAPATGDAANLTAYVSKDDGTLTALGDTSAAEISSTNAPGWYRWDVTQSESNANKLLFTGKSSTSNVVVVGRPIYTRPQYVADMVISSAGRPEVNTTHIDGSSGAANAIRDRVAQRTTLRGTVSTSSTTTSITTSAMSPATSVADQLKGRIVIFDHDTTTAALRGQATDITASSASATPTLTVTALTTAPASGDTFTIV